jgi:delta1-piperideine-2-carboxylate reductase
MSQTVSIGELTDIVCRILVRHGVRQDNAAPVAETVVAAERDGCASHGLLRLPGYIATLQSGWVDGTIFAADLRPRCLRSAAISVFAYILLTGDRGFESLSLQRRVGCETRLSPAV